MTGNEKAFAACPLCHQYSHSIGEDHLAEAFMHFETMVMNEMKGYPTHYAFDERTRDMAQVLVAAAKAARVEAFEEAAKAGYQACAETRHVTLGDKVAAAIRKLSEGGAS